MNQITYHNMKVSHHSLSILTIKKLFNLSNFFLNKAHKIVLSTRSKKGCYNYFKLIKLSIKSLLLIFDKFKLSLTTEVKIILFLKLAKCYFSETNNIKVADYYVNKAFFIASRSNLVHLRFLCEFLTLQILNKSNQNLFFNYLNKKIGYYKGLDLNNYSNLLCILKINELLTCNYNVGLMTLQNFSESNNIDTLTKILSLLYQSSLLLYRGSPKNSFDLLNKVQLLFDNYKEQVPIQIFSMFYILKFYNCIQLSNHEEVKVILQKIIEIIISGQNSNWSDWNENSIFEIKIPLNNNTAETYLIYYVKWLNSDEFVIMFYFLMGLSSLFQNFNLKKTKKIFDKSLLIINEQINNLKYDSNHKIKLEIFNLSKKILKIEFIKYNIYIYQVWLCFLNNDFSSIHILNDFIYKFNNRKFTEEQVTCFNLLIPKIIYLFALYYQNKNDVQAAKYFFLKVYNLTNIKLGIVDIKSSFLQFSLNIGCESIEPKNLFNELFVFSTIHSLILNEFELHFFSNYDNDSKNKLFNESYKLNVELKKNLDSAFQKVNCINSFSSNFVHSNNFLTATYNILSLIKLRKKNEEDNINDCINESELNKMQEIQTKKKLLFYPFLNNLFTFLIYKNTSDIKKKNCYLEKCFEILSVSTQSNKDKLLKILIFKNIIYHFKNNGENDKANMALLQLQFLESFIEPILKMLINNVLYLNNQNRN